MYEFHKAVTSKGYNGINWNGMEEDLQHSKNIFGLWVLKLLSVYMYDLQTQIKKMK